MIEDIYEMSDNQSDTSIDIDVESCQDTELDSSIKESFSRTVSDVDCSRLKIQKKKIRQKKRGDKRHVRQNVIVSMKGNLSPMFTTTTLGEMIDKSCDLSSKNIEVNVVIDQDKTLLNEPMTSSKNERKSVAVTAGIKSENETSSTSQSVTGE